MGSAEKIAKLLKEFVGKGEYSNIPGKTSIKEFFADILSPFADTIGISERIITTIAPDMKAYWGDGAFGSKVRSLLTERLKDALKEDDDVLLISHSLGTMISYDVLWKFSHYSEYKKIRGKKVSKWVTLGSPLGNETVKKNLKGAQAKYYKDKYPGNIEHWINIAAEDDYIAHDETISDDYAAMKKEKLITKIEDDRIYNLAVREGKSNPHHAVGYLIHPTLSKIVTEWLRV